MLPPGKIRCGFFDDSDSDHDDQPTIKTEPETRVCIDLTDGPSRPNRRVEIDPKDIIEISDDEDELPLPLPSQHQQTWSFQNIQPSRKSNREHSRRKPPNIAAMRKRNEQKKKESKFSEMRGLTTSTTTINPRGRQQDVSGIRQSSRHGFQRERSARTMAITGANSALSQNDGQNHTRMKRNTPSAALTRDLESQNGTASYVSVPGRVIEQTRSSGQGRPAQPVPQSWNTQPVPVARMTASNPKLSAMQHKNNLQAKPGVDRLPRILGGRDSKAPKKHLSISSSSHTKSQSEADELFGGSERSGPTHRVNQNPFLNSRKRKQDAIDVGSQGAAISSSRRVATSPRKVSLPAANEVAPVGTDSGASVDTVELQPTSNHASQDMLSLKEHKTSTNDTSMLIGDNISKGETACGLSDHVPRAREMTQASEADSLPAVLSEVPTSSGNDVFLQLCTVQSPIDQEAVPAGGDFNDTVCITPKTTTNHAPEGVQIRGKHLPSANDTSVSLVEGAAKTTEKSQEASLSNEASAHETSERSQASTPMPLSSLPEQKNQVDEPGALTERSRDADDSTLTPRSPLELPETSQVPLVSSHDSGTSIAEVPQATEFEPVSEEQVSSDTIAPLSDGLNEHIAICSSPDHETNSMDAVDAESHPLEKSARDLLMKLNMDILGVNAQARRLLNPQYAISETDSDSSSPPYYSYSIMQRTWTDSDFNTTAEILSTQPITDLSEANREARRLFNVLLKQYTRFPMLSFHRRHMDDDGDEPHAHAAGFAANSPPHVRCYFEITVQRNVVL